MDPDDPRHSMADDRAREVLGSIRADIDQWFEHGEADTHPAWCLRMIRGAIGDDPDLGIADMPPDERAATTPLPPATDTP